MLKQGTHETGRVDSSAPGLTGAVVVARLWCSGVPHGYFPLLTICRLRFRRCGKPTNPT